MRQFKEKRVWRNTVWEKTSFSQELLFQGFLDRYEECPKIRVHFPKYSEAKRQTRTLFFR